jgi:hypothetical protein
VEPEYPSVVIPVMTQHYAMLQRNFLYTGVTRGKRLVVLVGQKKAVAVAVRNVSGRRRWSKLAEWLSADVSKRYDVGRHRATWRSRLHLASRKVRKVNCIVSSMHRAEVLPLATSAQWSEFWVQSASRPSTY